MSGQKCCGFCGALMQSRSYVEVDYSEGPNFDRDSGEQKRNPEKSVPVWACPNADLEDYQLFSELEPHDVEAAL